jgi:hypothetical protein
LTFLCGRDLAVLPPRLLWEFNYDYVNVPGVGRPWPPVSQWGNRYEYGGLIMGFTVVATLAVAALLVAAWRTRRTHEEEVELADELRHPVRDLAIAAGLLVVGIACGPATPQGLAPVIPRWLWLIPTAIMLLAFARYGHALLRSPVQARGRMLGLVAAVAVAWTGFAIDKALVELSPHWAQKHVVAAYYKERTGPEEPLVAWQLYWRGENFYTRNEIYDPKKQPLDKTVFLGDRNSERLSEYLKTHGGRRVFFVVERVRFESLRSLLPADARAGLQIVDQSNNKLYLASARLR